MDITAKPIVFHQQWTYHKSILKKDITEIFDTKVYDNSLYIYLLIFSTSI